MKKSEAENEKGNGSWGHYRSTIVGGTGTVGEIF